MASMSPSGTITKGQCGKFADLQINALAKSGLPSEPTQLVLEQQGAEVAAEFVQIVRQRVEAISELIVRHVRKDPRRTNREVINATGRIEHVNSDALATMPRGGNEEVDIVFFPIKRNAGPAEARAAYDHHNLEPDPEGVAKVNEDDPSFADQYPNACQWRDSEGRWTYVAFGRRRGERSLLVDRVDDGWDGGWFLGGVRKSSTTS